MRLAFLFLPFTLCAQLPMPKVGSQVHSSYLFSETFDGSTLCATSYTSNCDNSWTVIGGSPVFNYATSPAPLVGSYSLGLAGATQAVYAPITGHTGTATLYAAFIFSPSGTGASHTHTFRLMTSAGAALGQVNLVWSTSTYNIRIYYSAETGNQSFTAAMANGEKWYIKAQYTPGTGANGNWQLFAVKDSSGFPGWGAAKASFTTATDTADVGRIQVGPTASSSIGSYDGIRVSLSDITYP